jgi:hypothetical protein
MKGRVNFRAIVSVEIRYEAWDYISENGVICGNLSNELVMFRVQLSKFVRLAAWSECLLRGAWMHMWRTASWSVRALSHGAREYPKMM